jgi:cellulose synthase/poly-beta-1,6-N-acetylglucosamine synthase-like glycosyltransferase
VILELLGLLVLVPCAVLFVQVMASMEPKRESAPAGRRPRLAVLVPAHNEARGIQDCLTTISGQLQKADRLLVVADNCTDDTAALAASAGAEVVERRDAARRGKGYALDFGIRHLAADPPETLLVIDADCRLDAGAVDCLARACHAAERPVQALYLMHAGADAGPAARIAQFAWLVKNQVRALGSQRLGMPCLLTGSGMAFPWRMIERAALASAHLVEDLHLSIDLARAGTPALLCPRALVTSAFAAGPGGLQAQRMRWEHGHLSVILADVPRLLLEGVVKGQPRLVGMALDLCVPPLALLALVVAALAASGAAAALVAAALLGSAVLAAWWRHGRELPLGALACAPFYALAKIPLYSRFLVKRQVEWVRSRRPGE